MIRIRAALAVIPGVRVWRNNVGFAKTANGSPVHFGLAKGSADLIGVAWGRFVSLEVKRPGGTLEEDQVRWRDAVRRLGGIAECVTSEEEALAAIEPARPR